MFASVAVARLSDSEVSPGVALLSETRLLCCGRNQVESTITTYNFGEQKWSEPKDLPFSLTQGMAMSECNGYMYFIGGADDPPASSSSIIKYSVTSNVILKISKLKSTSYKSGAQSLNGIIYIVGGINSHGIPLRLVQTFNPDSQESGITSSSTNEAHVQPLIAALKDCLYVISQNTTAVEKYCPVSEQWTQISTGHQEHLIPSVAAYSGMLYLAKTWHSKVFHIYDPSTGRWQVKKFTGGPDALYGMWSHGTCSPEADFFFVRDGNMALYMYKPKEREWKKLSDPINSPWNPHQTIICSKRHLV